MRENYNNETRVQVMLLEHLLERKKKQHAKQFPRRHDNDRGQRYETTREATTRENGRSKRNKTKAPITRNDSTHESPHTTKRNEDNNHTTTEQNENNPRKRETQNEATRISKHASTRTHLRTQAPYLIPTTGGLLQTEFRIKDPGQSLRARPEHGQHFAGVAHQCCVGYVCLSFITACLLFALLFFSFS